MTKSFCLGRGGLRGGGDIGIWGFFSTALLLLTKEVLLSSTIVVMSFLGRRFRDIGDIGDFIMLELTFSLSLLLLINEDFFLSGVRLFPLLE